MIDEMSIHKTKAVRKNAAKRTIKQNEQAHHSHPDHSTHLIRINRVKGQINGIENMIVEKRYCPDIINQIKAARAALQSIEAAIFKTHLQGCVKNVLKSRDVFEAENKIQEIVKMIY